MIDQVYLILDYETRSKADLGEVGSWEYSVHSSTRVMCVAWRLGTRATLRSAPIRSWCPAFHEKRPQELLNAFTDSDVMLVAHNALFEELITENVLSRQFPQIRHIPVSRWICTAALAAVMALPRKLEKACIAAKLPVQKDMDGHRLMLKLSQPRKPSKHNPAIWHNKASEFRRLIKYCEDDIAAETELFLKLPPLIYGEREVWELDQKINRYGFHVDREFVALAQNIIANETARMQAEVIGLSGGYFTSINQRAKVLELLNDVHKIDIPNLQAKTIDDLLDSDKKLPQDARRILEIRRSIGKASLKKYPAFEARSKSDSRVRDNVVYHGAGPGRFTGRGLQIQNFPRGTWKDFDSSLAIEHIKTLNVEGLHLLYGEDLMSLLSNCLRSTIIASPGYEIYCGDYASIEVRVLFWVAGHISGLKAYEEKRDLYREMAVKIYNRNLEDVSKSEREVGKRAILGCGYGMGADKFHQTCIQFGQEVSEELAQKAVSAYRETHNKVPLLWKNLETAAKSAVKNPGKKYTINKTTWFVEKEVLFCELPSGRRLAYYYPSVRMERNQWGYVSETLFHFGEDSKTRQWKETKTWGGVLTENVVQAIARDLMVDAMLRLDEYGFEIILTVHDEIVAEMQRKDCLEKFSWLMSRVPAWGQGIPVEVEAWQGPRYRK